MHVFKRVSESYGFELKNKDLYVTANPDSVQSALTYPQGRVPPGFKSYEPIKGLPALLVIEDYLDRIKTPEASNIIQIVLSGFHYTFKPHEDQREQLRKGLRYFSLADHYNVLSAALPQEMLDGAKARYTELLEKITSLEHDYVISEQMIQKFHINEPLVATTGLVVHATINHNWYVYETNQPHSDLPEYLFNVLHHNDFKLTTNADVVFTGTQNECLNYVRDKQKEIYGISLDEFKTIKTKLDNGKRVVDDLEVLLDVPFKDTLAGKTELAEKEQQTAEKLEENLNYINLASKNVGAKND
jgi:hypothetical protein